MTNTALYYESSFYSVPQCSQPDRYIPGVSVNKRPNDNFVISRRVDGSILSKYGDDAWLLWPYRTTAQQPSPLNFANLPNNAKSDIKWLIFILIYLGDTGRASTLSPRTLIEYMILLRRLSNFSSQKNTTPCAVLGSESLLRNFAHDLVEQGTIFKRLAPLLTQIFFLGIDLTGINVLNESTINEVIQCYRARYQTIRQYAVIPPRIYSQLLTQYWNVIDIVDRHKNTLSCFIKRCNCEIAYARSRSAISPFGAWKKNNPRFEEAVKSHDLTELFTRFEVHSLTQLTRFLTRVQHTCKELIHAYSGMRNDEVLSLKIDCLRIEKDKHGERVHLLGETSKLIGQRKATAWVTSAEIKRVVGIGKIIALLVADYKGFKAEITPLFVSVSYLPFCTCEPNFKEAPIVNGSLNQKKNQASQLTNVNHLKIQEEDIKHLEKIDPLRAWREEPEFQIGKEWHTTTHQWRRSLAFYVAQSGLVSLPTLKRQLQHITREMSVYYSNGAGFSDLFNTSDHFTQALKKTKPEADALAYIYNIILSDEPIKGAHGYHLKSYGELAESNKIMLLEDRKKTIEMFRNGEMFYRETALGACTSVVPCDNRLLRSVIACFSCPKAAIKTSKVTRLVQRQQQFVGQLDQSSIEYQTEKKELEQLLQLREKLNQNPKMKNNAAALVE